MIDMKAVVFANADINDYSFCEEYIKDAVVICCDGGMRHAMKLDITPDYIVGDFDSVSTDVLEYYKKQNIELKQVPCRKDETDMELGISHAVEIGADDITFIGGIGSRMDHTMANIFQLIRINKLGIKGKILNENNIIVLSTGKTEIKGEKGDIVSFIPLTPEVKGVSTYGLEYPLDKATLYMDSPLGVSNVMEGERAGYTFDEGMALVIKAKD
ncbi:MAG: thiamine diphosphokinase [Clostridiales bacterium]|nr:thiamine diphosphokinase [Clostridiales bacterium]